MNVASASPAWCRYDVLNPVVKEVSFRVPGGKTVAFVGATGSGEYLGA